MQDVIIGGELYQLRQMSKETINDFTLLFNYTKELNVSSEFFRRKYTNLPESPFYYGFLIYKNGIAVAHCGVLPLKGSIAKTEYSIGQWTDTVTHPDFQKKGLNKFLTEHLLDYCKSMGMKFIFRFTNPISSKITQEKYSWLQNGNLICYYKKTIAIPLFKISAKLKLSELYEFYFSLICAIYKANFFSFNSRKYSEYLSMNRDENFIKYKRFTNSKLIQICAGKYKLWVKVEDGLMIGDYCPKIDSNPEEVLAGLKWFCFFAGLHQVKFVTSDNHPLCKIWESHCQKMIFNPVMIKDLSGEKLYEKLILTGADRNIF